MLAGQVVTVEREVEAKMQTGVQDTIRCYAKELFHSFESGTMSRVFC